MTDDIAAGLTRAVKEEVIENYLFERHLIELQIEHLDKQADETRRYAWMAGRRLARLSFLMIYSGMQRQLLEMLGMDTGFWSACVNVTFRRKVPFIRVRALTQKGKFRKLLLESYSRLHDWMEKYKQQYEDLESECAAVNSNIGSFQKNFDLLSILSFIRNLDIQAIEKKKVLGDNFTAGEMAELDKNLSIRLQAMEKLNVPAPVDLPDPDSMRAKLSDLAEEIFQRYGEEVKKILK